MVSINVGSVLVQANPDSSGMPVWAVVAIALISVVGTAILPHLVGWLSNKEKNDAEKQSAVSEVKNEAHEAHITQLKETLDDCEQRSSERETTIERLRREHDERSMELGKLRGQWETVEKYILGEGTEDEH